MLSAVKFMRSVTPKTAREGSQGVFDSKVELDPRGIGAALLTMSKYRDPPSAVLAETIIRVQEVQQVALPLHAAAASLRATGALPWRSASVARPALTDH